MITFRHSGDFKKLNSFMERALNVFDLGILDKYGKLGVKALSEYTPKDSGLTADSWYYGIERHRGSVSISFYNSNENQNVPIAILIQYGHATNNGGYVTGTDYVNPAIIPIFDQLAEDLWKEVVRK